MPVSSPPRAQQLTLDANIETQGSDFVAGLLERVVDAGYGEETVMAPVKVL